MILASGLEAISFEKLVAQSGIPHRSVAAGPDVNPALFSRLRREIQGWGPDIVHSHLIHADLYGQLTAAAHNVVGVASFHSSNPFYERFPMTQFARFAYRNTSLVIAISNHVAMFVERLQLIDSGKVRVIPYGIDVDDWAGSVSGRQGRASFGMKHGFAIGVASRLFPKKGHDVVIGALADSLPPDWHLYIGGDGPLRGDLQSLAARTLRPGSYSFLGFIEDIAGFMSACDVMVFPTTSGFGEGFGLAALEAMAVGVPVVASRLDSLPEVVEDGETGILVDPGDPRALRDALQSLAEDEHRRECMGAAGRRRARTHFSIERMAEATVSAYGEVL